MKSLASILLVPCLALSQIHGGLHPIHGGIIKKTLTSSITAGGNISPSGRTSIKRGTNQTYTFSPYGLSFDSVFIDGVYNATASGAGSYTFTNVTTNHTIRVVLIPYGMYDEYSDAHVAGSVNGTYATDGVNLRTVTDTKPGLSITAGNLSVTPLASPSESDPSIQYPSVVRVGGRMLIGRIESYSDRFYVGWYSTVPNNQGTARALSVVNLSFAPDASHLLTVADGEVYSNITAYCILRGAGSVYLATYNAVASPVLMWIGSANTTSPLIPAYAAYSGVVTSSYLRIPQALWLPTPLASDGFGTAFGTSDGLGHAEGIAGGLGSGGGGLAWSHGGTWTVSGGKASNNPTLGAEIITTPDFSSGTGWTAGAGWVIAAGVATGTATSATLTDASTVTIGGNYQYGITVGATPTNSVTTGIGGLTSVAYSTAGVKLATGRATSTGVYTITGATYAGTVDDATAKFINASTLYATVETNTADVLASADLVVTAGMQAGVVMSYANTLNLCLAYHDGTNCKLDKCVAGTWTSVISAAATYSSGATIRCIKDGTNYSLFYNNAKVGSTSTISDVALISNTKHGIFSTYSGNTLDNFTVYARGTNGEYNTLGTWSQP